MKFATKEFSSNGQAALALTAALLAWLEKNGTLIPKDKREIVEEAMRLAPHGVGRIDEESREILQSLL